MLVCVLLQPRHLVVGLLQLLFELFDRLKQFRLLVLTRGQLGLPRLQFVLQVVDPVPKVRVIRLLSAGVLPIRPKRLKLLFDGFLLTPLQDLVPTFELLGVSEHIPLRSVFRQEPLLILEDLLLLVDAARHHSRLVQVQLEAKVHVALARLCRHVRAVQILARAGHRLISQHCATHGGEVACVQLGILDLLHDVLLIEVLTLLQEIGLLEGVSVHRRPDGAWIDLLQRLRYNIEHHPQK